MQVARRPSPRNQFPRPATVTLPEAGVLGALTVIASKAVTLPVAIDHASGLTAANREGQDATRAARCVRSHSSPASQIA
jgi:hypothetical protein